MAFIDWVSCSLPLTAHHEINGGSVVSFEQDGRIEWATDRRLPVEGSHSSTVHVRTHGRSLQVSGNPTKFLQGHNLFGSSDLAGLIVAIGIELCGDLGVPVSEDDLTAWRAGHVPLTRIDGTRMTKLPPGTVPAWLSVAGACVNGGHQRVTNPGVYEGNTLYVGQHSRRISLKMYDKASELRKHPLPLTIASEDRGKLVDWASDTLRTEVVLRGMELKDRHLQTASMWTPAIIDALIDERLGKLTMLDNLTLADDAVQNLPPRLVGVYEAWRAGRDLSTIYSNGTFYRYRAALREYGIDISKVRPRIVQPETQYPLGRPLRDFLSGSGMEPPEWAVGTPLLACS